MFDFSEKARYHRAWNAYDRRSVVELFCYGGWKVLGIADDLLAFVPALFFTPLILVFFGLFFLSEKLGIRSLEAQVFFCIAVIAALIFGPICYVRSFACPRCRRNFGRGVPNAQEQIVCPHCALPLYAEPEN